MELQNEIHCFIKKRRNLIFTTKRLRIVRKISAKQFLMSSRSFRLMWMFWAHIHRAPCAASHSEQCDNDAIIMCCEIVSQMSRRWCIMWNSLHCFFLFTFVDGKFSFLMVQMKSRLLTVIVSIEDYVIIQWIYKSSPRGLNESFSPRILRVFRFKCFCKVFVVFSVDARGLSISKRRLNKNQFVDSKIVRIRITFPAARCILKVNEILISTRVCKNDKNRKRTEYDWESRQQRNHRRWCFNRVKSCLHVKFPSQFLQRKRYQLHSFTKSDSPRSQTETKNLRKFSRNSVD